MSTPQVELINADCFHVLPSIPDCSFDACVIDGPYGIRFMGKAWDGADIEKTIATKVRKKECTKKYFKRGVKHEGRVFAAGQYNTCLITNRAFQSWTREWATQMFRILKPGAYIASFGSTRTYHRMASGIEDAGFEIRDQLAWIFGSGFPKSHNLDGDREGWGTALKPGWEPICLGRKPLSGTVAENVERHGTGALNIKGCRVPVDAGLDAAQIRTMERGKRETGDGWGLSTIAGGQTPVVRPEGRWPANVCHDGSEEVLAAFPDSDGQQGDLAGHSRHRISKGIFGDMPAARDAAARGDKGSAARFFYCAKASRADRNAGCENMPEKQLLWSSGTQNPGSFQSENTERNVTNFHPTVKPTALMRWLCRLITPPGGRVIDSLMGSGSTGRGAVLEGFSFTGIEREGPYFAIAQARIAEAQGELFKT